MGFPGRRPGVEDASEPAPAPPERGPVRRPEVNPGSEAAAGAAMLRRTEVPAGVSNRAVAQMAEPATPDDPAVLAERGHAAVGLAAAALPAFRQAVDALDPAAAFDRARVVIEMARGARSDLERAAGHLAGAGFALDWPTQALFAQVQADQRRLDEMTARLAYDLGPRTFRGTVVAGDAVPAEQQSIEGAAVEAALTVELVNTVRQVRELVGTAQAAGLQQAIDLAEGWRGRPVNFMFLYTALDREHLLAPLSVLGGAQTGRNIFQLRHKAEESAKAFGMLLDAGTFDLDRAATLLSYYWDDWAITDQDAQKVVEMWASAAPDARVAILEKLQAEGVLGRLCDNVPGLATRAMNDVAARRPDSPAAATLRAAVEDLPQGTTASELYEQKIMENIEEENYVRGYLWTFLNVAHSALTLGFKDIHDTAYAQMREGLISSDEYWSTTTKAAGRTAVLLAATAVTGGAAGGLAEGVALGRGVAPTLAGLIGGTTGGAVSSVAGQLTADLYDQALLGKEGFSSAGDYLTAAGAGAGGGLVLSGVGAIGARVAPASAQETFRYHSGGGRYRVLQDFRQGLHGMLYKVYRGSVGAGRRIGSGGVTTGNADLFEPDRIRHILTGEGNRRGGHQWPSNPKGGQPPTDPKTPFPRAWNENRILDVVAEITTNPATVWTQQTGPGQGGTVTGLPTRPPTTAAGAPVRYRANVVVDGVTIQVIVEPGGEGIISAFPIGFEDPANLLQFVRPQPGGEEQEE